MLAGPHPRSRALRRSQTRYPRAGRGRCLIASRLWIVTRLGRVSRETCEDRARQIAQPGDGRHDADAGDAAPDELVGHEIAERGQGVREEVLLPERGPRRHDEQQSRLDKVRSEQKTGGEANK